MFLSCPPRVWGTEAKTWRTNKIQTRGRPRGHPSDLAGAEWAERTRQLIDFLNIREIMGVHSAQMCPRVGQDTNLVDQSVVCATCWKATSSCVDKSKITPTISLEPLSRLEMQLVMGESESGGRQPHCTVHYGSLRRRTWKPIIASITCF